MQKQTVIFEEIPKWRIYKGKFFCQIGPLSRDRARILYLIILCMQQLHRGDAPLHSAILSHVARLASVVKSDFHRVATFINSVQTYLRLSLTSNC